MHESNLPRTAKPSEDGGVRLVGGTTRSHGAKTHGSSDAGTLFARVFLAAPRSQWGVLPSLPVCASAYQYDWKTMRRGNRVEAPVAETTSVRRRSGQKQPTWMPRARRLRSNLPVRYRGKNLHTWYEGLIQNISQSGVMFHGPQQLPANALGELIFEMPKRFRTKEQQCTLPGQAHSHRGRA